jgi:hypothetical protein
MQEFPKHPWATFAMQYPPFLIPSKFPGHMNRRKYELTQYAQSMVNDWPFEYKLEGPLLEKWIVDNILDVEFVDKKDKFFYCKMNNTEKLDPALTLITNYLSDTPHEFQPTVILSDIHPHEILPIYVQENSIQSAQNIFEVACVINMMETAKSFAKFDQEGCPKCEGTLTGLQRPNWMDQISGGQELSMEFSVECQSRV